MDRPKSSFAGLGTLGLTAYNSRKLNKMKREFADLQESQRNNSEYIGKELRNIRDLHIASFAGLTVLSNQITDLSKSQWDILRHLEDRELKNEILGDLKLLLINTEEEIERINTLGNEFPEYSLLLIRELKNTFEENGVRIEQFKSLPPSEIKWAKSVLNSIGSVYTKLYNQVKEG